MNTQFNYLYRDASNYKKPGQIVLRGLPAAGVEAFDTALKAFLSDGQFFIAGQIAVPEVFLWSGPGAYKVGENDHCWHEYSDVESVKTIATDERTPEQFLLAVEAANQAGWQEFDPVSR